jgi:hypothetical protein
VLYWLGASRHYLLIAVPTRYLENESGFLGGAMANSMLNRSFFCWRYMKRNLGAEETTSLTNVIVFLSSEKLTE